MSHSGQSPKKKTKTMTPEAVAANIANALFSTGPTSEAGKKRVRMNPTWHGLFGQDVVLPWEDEEAYGVLAQSVFLDYSPVTTVEYFLVEHIVDRMWEMKRLKYLKKEIIVEYKNENGYREEMIDDIERLTTLEIRVENSIFRADKRLHEIKERRYRWRKLGYDQYAEEEIEAYGEVMENMADYLGEPTYDGPWIPKIHTQAAVAIKGLVDAAKRREFPKARSNKGKFNQAIRKMADIAMSTEESGTQPTAQPGPAQGASAAASPAQASSDPETPPPQTGKTPPFDPTKNRSSSCQWFYRKPRKNRRSRQKPPDTPNTA